MSDRPSPEAKSRVAEARTVARAIHVATAETDPITTVFALAMALAQIVVILNWDAARLMRLIIATYEDAQDSKNRMTN